MNLVKQILSISTALFLIISVNVSFSQKEALQLLFVGDVMQHDGQIAAAHNKKSDSYNYKDCFKFVKPIISQADIAVANLEVTHAGKPYKGYPQFSAPPELSEAIVDAGFNVIITANNHSCDGGAKGVVKTLDVLDRIGVAHTGTFRNKKERDENYPLVVEKKGYKIAILNYTYGTNGLTVPAPLIINYIDSATMKADFEKAKKMGVDYIVCTLHWGEEYKTLPNAYQKKWEDFCYKHGADMVIGSHPHVLQPVEKKEIQGKDKLTAWSLGNFISNQRDRYKDGGMILRANIQEVDKQIKIKEVDYLFTWVFPRQEGHTKPFYILPDFAYNQYKSEFLSAANVSQMKTFYQDSRALFSQHSKNVSEFLVSSHEEWTNLYSKQLKGYFSIKLEEKPTGVFETTIHLDLKNDFHQFTNQAGKYYLLSGMFTEKSEAEFHLKFLKDVGYSSGEVIWIEAL
jgi:poly-gamma-glutamate capsule biosynthesis protein CapA/YwtB (metallophosphatase superfamily)